MAKQMNPMNIPMNSKLSLAEVDDLIHNTDNPSFAEKNSITYQGIIRNAHITQDNGYLTTTGKTLKKSQLYDGDKKIGTTFIDENGKEYKVPHNWLLKKSFQLKKYTGGREISAAIYDNKIYILYNDEGLWSLVTVDAETLELINLKILENIVSATIGSVYGKENDHQAPTLWILKSQTKSSEDIYNNIIEWYELKDGGEAEKKTYTHTGAPLGLKLTATHLLNRGMNMKMVGFEDIDQERRAFFRCRSSAPDTLEYNKYFGTVSPSGLVTGEPIPVYTVNKTGEHPVIETKRLDNGCIAWNIQKVVDDLKPGQYELTMEFKFGERADGTNMSFGGGEQLAFSQGKAYYMYDVNISNNDAKTGDYPEDDPRSKPGEWFISNFADSKGVYFDWGVGWAKSYFRRVLLESKLIYLMSLMTLGGTIDANNTGYGLIRNESLIPQPDWEHRTSYTPGHLNEVVYTIGGTNKGDESILGAIPFAVDLLYQGYGDAEDLQVKNFLKTQIYDLVETSYSVKSTLLTTPSEDKDDDLSNNLNVQFYKGKSLLVFSKGEFYEVIKSSDFNDCVLTKVADYSFKLNVLDNKNLFKEDRDGNISLVKAFIPYNMECAINIKDLKISRPPAPDTDNPEKDYDAMAKDPNDAWFEGVGYNVNLDVEDPAMSFLLPKIRLPLWISEKDWTAFKNEAIDRRNSILQPVLTGCFDNNESVDVYYTLQNDKQDCTYKNTQIVKNDTKEAVAAKWNVYGKATYDVLKKGMSWWMEEANTTIFPIGIGSTIAGINFITPSAQLPQGYASRLYTQNNRLFMGFNFLSQIWHGATIFTIYGSNYYYDGQGIYFVGSDQDFSNNNFVTYALGMKFLANSGSEAFFYSDFEKRIYVFTGSNTLQAADLLSSIEGTIVDAVYSSKEQALYMLTSKGRILVRTQTDLCQLPGMNVKGHLEGTTEGAAMIDNYNYKIFSPWKGKNVLPFALRTEHFGSTDYVSKLAYVDILLYKNEDTNPLITLTCQTLNGIEKKSEKINIKIKPEDWRGNTYKVRFTPKLNIGNAFDIGIYSMNKIGIQSLCMFLEPISTGKGDAWQNNVVNETPSVGLIPNPPAEGTINNTPSISVF